MSISVFENAFFGGLFGDPALGQLWSPDAQLDHYRAFEAALAQALAANRQISKEAGANAARSANTAALDIPAIAQASARDGVPIPEFVRQLREAAGDNAHAIHTGSTSQDVMDTALSLTLKGVTEQLVSRLVSLDNQLSALETTFGNAPLMGRTRMQAALPITAGDRIASWRHPLKSHHEALVRDRANVERLQLGGALGTRQAFDDSGDAISAHMALALNLTDGPCWHTDRTVLVNYASRLSLITGSLGKMGQDIALMAQQGVDEIALAGGGGSSAMPHKSNPVRAELLVTLARFNATQISGLHHAIVHEQERSGAAWMLEWMILPQVTMATGRALTAAIELIEQITRIGSAP